jgi:KH domain-containing protein
MKKIISEKVPRIIKNRKKLEKELNIKIIYRGKEIFIEGKSEDEFIAEKVIDALNFGFPFSIALEIKRDGSVFEIINVKEYTNKKNLRLIRARIIGTKAKTLKTLGELTKCSFELKDNYVGIIGPAEEIENAQNSLIMLIQGTKQSNVYKYLEKHKSEPILDLGLKE